MVKLSLCMIARNEERCLGRAIRSFEGLADEIIVVDTGSTDRSPEIAMELGAQVRSIAWDDDFGAAREASFAEATGEWIFMLDADEWLLPGSKSAMQKALEDPSAMGYHLVREDRVGGRQGELLREMWQLRLFRREGRPPMVGCCHMHFRPSLEEVALSRGQQVLANSALRLGHDGYTPEAMPSKMQRSVRLCRKELSLRPGQIYYISELTRTLYRLKDPEWIVWADAGVELVREALPLAQNSATGFAPFLEFLMTLPDHERPSGVDLEQLFELSLRWFPQCAPLHWQVARIAYAKDMWGVAVDRLERLDALRRSGTFDRTIPFHPRLLGDAVLLNLAAAYTRCNRLADATKTYQSLVRHPEFGDAARKNLAVLRGMTGRR